MKQTLTRPELRSADLLNRGMVVYDPLEPDKKVEPFYFDARRGASALPLDIGFVPDAFNMTTTAYPAVEILCLIGLQRGCPRSTKAPRVFEYQTWSVPRAASLISPALCGHLPDRSAQCYRFESSFRTTQRKHKSFLPAFPVGEKL